MSATETYPVGRVRPEDTAMELKCVVTTPVLRFLEQRLGRSRTRELISDTRMNPDYLEHTENWISYDYFCRLLRKVVEATGEPRAPLIAARDCSTMGTYGVVARFLKHLGSPGHSYQLIVRFHGLWTKVNTWRILESSAGRCTIEVQPARVTQDRNNCLAIQGSLAAVTRPYDLPFARVTELQCACEGAPSCIYLTEWKERASRLWDLAGCVAGVVVSSLVCWLLGTPPPATTAIAAFGILAGCFAGRTLRLRGRLREAYDESVKQADSLLNAIHATEDANRNLQARVEQRTRELHHANTKLQQALQDLRESQERMLITEKQAAMGVLAGGMAHELNNPLNAIQLTVQGLEEDLADRPELTPLLQNARHAARRCARIVRELLVFTRESGHAQRVRIERVLAAALSVFKTEAPAGIRVRQVIAPALPEIHVDQAQMQQVILAILSNASDAMGGAGDIDVSLAPVEGVVELVIRDHGPGISDSIRQRIFDPFFTTKSPGKGLGLGLAIAYQLVQKNGGTISVASREGEGASFTLRFPHVSTETGRSGTDG